MKSIMSPRRFMARTRGEVSPSSGRVMLHFPYIHHGYRLRHFLLAIVLFSLLGLFVNIRYAMKDDSSYSIHTRKVVESYQQGIPTEMENLFVAFHDNGFSSNETTTTTTTLYLENEAKNGFSACLIVKDDNHWLIEWIAYHYHVLPLRHLILVSDPTALTSPANILDRWRDRMIIDEWQDEDFLPEWIPRKAKKKNSSELWLHLNRQNVFYAKCLQNLTHRERGWVTLIDTDEFVRINPYRHKVDPNLRKKAGHISRFLNLLQPDIGNRTCLLLPRIQVSNVEKPMPSWSLFGSRKTLIPAGFNASDFLTLRFLYHNEHEMEAGKDIINLKYLQDVPEKRTPSVHHVHSSCPNNTGDSLHKTDSHLQIQHYLGTYEQFTYRDDPRDVLHDRYANWHTRGRNPDPHKRDVDTSDWLSGFVEREGMDKAFQLLKGVGKLEPREDGDSRKREVPVGPISPETFSACLIMKDDNHYLVEWLAYHYHVLPLRDLIVMVDPASRSSPKHIFRRWIGRMSIETWNEHSVLPTHIFKKVARGNMTASALHRQRQQFFYGHCLRALKERNATWVLLSDTDEFVAPHPDPKASHRVTHSLVKPAAVRKIIQMRIKSRKTKDQTYAPSCLLVPRLQMTSQLPKEAGVIDQGVPKGFSGNDFLTTKWLFHNGQEIHTGHNLDGKNIINLKNLNLNQIPSKVLNVHHVLPHSCPISDGKRLNHPDTWLWIYHYLGSLEQFTYRIDPRDEINGRPKRNETLWKTAGRRQGEAILREDAIAIRGWLEGFVKSVGWFEAKRLLNGAGQTEKDSLWRLLLG